MHFDRKRELKKLNHSVLVNFLDLIDILVMSPESPRRTEKIDDLTLLFVHIHHLLNEYRPHQARETLRVMLELQKRQRVETSRRWVDWHRFIYFNSRHSFTDLIIISKKWGISLTTRAQISFRLTNPIWTNRWTPTSSTATPNPLRLTQLKRKIVWCVKLSTRFRLNKREKSCFHNRTLCFHRLAKPFCPNINW